MHNADEVTAFFLLEWILRVAAFGRKWFKDREIVLLQRLALDDMLNATCAACTWCFSSCISTQKHRHFGSRAFKPCWTPLLFGVLELWWCGLALHVFFQLLQLKSTADCTQAATAWNIPSWQIMQPLNIEENMPSPQRQLLVSGLY